MKKLILTFFILALATVFLDPGAVPVLARENQPVLNDGREIIWTVRISSFEQVDNAWDFMDYLQKEGMKPDLVRLYDSNGKLWRVVQIGSYPSKSQARIAGRIFKKKTGLDYLVRSMPVELLDKRRAESRNTPLPEGSVVFKKNGGSEAAQAVQEEAGEDVNQEFGSRYGSLEGASEEFFYELDQRDVLRAVSKRQRNVILARIMIRRGYVNDGIRLYEKLLKIYPDDLELREEYIGVLLDNQDVGKAERLLRAWLQDDPASPRALRQDARLRLLTGNYEQQQATLGYLLRLRPGDTDSISAKAYSRQQGGDWLGAITSFSELIDKEPDNVDARRALSGLLRQRRPRLTFTPSVYLQPNETITTTLGGSFAMQLSSLTRGEVYYSNTNIYRPEGDGIEKIDKNINQMAFLFKRDLSRTFTGVFGAGAYDGSGSGVSGALGFDWMVHEPGMLSAMIDYNNPWLDEPTAANYEGRYNQFSLTYDGFYDDTWGLFINTQLRQYMIDSDRLYGHRGVFNVILTRRILADPDLFVSYSFYRSKFKYDNDNFTPIDIVRNEAIHTLSASFSKSLCDVIFIEGSGGVRADEFKTRLSYFGGPSLIIRLGRFEFNTGYEYSSDSGLAGGGETQLIRGGISFVF